MRNRRLPPHLWPAVLYVLTLIVWERGRTAGLLLALVMVGWLIVLRRREFRETSRRSLAGRRHTGMLVIDLNGFEPVGAFTQVLRQTVGSPGLTARLGEGRFAVVLPEVGSAEQAYEVAGRLAASVAPVIVAGRLTAMTASIGVAVSAPAELTCDELLRRAFVAMEKAREFAPHTRWAAWRESYESDADLRPPFSSPSGALSTFSRLSWPVSNYAAWTPRRRFAAIPRADR